ncbi:transposable element Tcb2 transposase [Trichonephila clavipes]|nr:transposable element Tcb2 transposase [Trichonephila clavipes]
MMPTWLHRQDFAKFPLNRHYNVSPELQCRMRTGIWPKETSGAQHQTCLVRSSATGTTVSRQTVYRRLWHIGLYAHRPVKCVPLTATHCRLRLTWSREHALWTPHSGLV